MNKRADNLLTIGLVVLLLVGAAWFLLPQLADSTSTTGTSTTVTATDSGATTDSGTTANSGSSTQSGDQDWSSETEPTISATINVDDLPPEAWDTMALIDQGGPFPYGKDGSVFQNREGRLPDHDMGWYREYTVDTPGSSDRGARRIVGGDDGVLYWTADHYDSFAEIRGR